MVDTLIILSKCALCCIFGVFTLRNNFGPAITILIHAFAPRFSSSLRVVLVALGAMSFIFATWTHYTLLHWSFYGLPSCVFQFVAGALIAVRQHFKFEDARPDAEVDSKPLSTRQPTYCSSRYCYRALLYSTVLSSSCRNQWCSRQFVSRRSRCYRSCISFPSTQPLASYHPTDYTCNLYTNFIA